MTRFALATPPAAPSSFEAFVTKFSHSAQFPHTYAFLWDDNSTDEEGFEIRYHFVGASGDFQFLTDQVTAATGTGGTGTVFSLLNIGAGTSIQFQVLAYKGTPKEYSTPSNNFTVTLPTQSDFTAPIGVTGTVVSESIVRASWTDTSETEDGVELWMIQLPGGTYSKLGDVAFYQTQQINVTGLNPGIGYRFKLRAYRLGATQLAPRTYSAFSAESAVVSPTPTAPTNLSVSDVGASKLTLTWTDNSSTETSHEILSRPTGTGTWTVHQIAAANATTATVTNLTPGVSLDLAVRARGDYAVTPGLSANSNVVTQLMKDVINSPHYAQVYVGQPFSYTLTTTTGSATVSRAISGLPSGLSFDGTSQIAGMPDTPGVTLATMTATFADGSSHSPGLSIRVLNPPVLGSAIPAQTVVTGTPLTVPMGAAFTDPEASSAAKVVTTLGAMNFILFNAAAPQTVANFMNYVNNGRYADTVFDRSVPGFVVQGGSLRPAGAPNGFTNAPKFDPVVNEPGLSNVRGTISLAKQPTDPNSGTNEFFVSLENNGAILDGQNGGFTVFGRVAGNGMTVADAIASKPTGSFSVVVDGTTRSVNEWPLNSPEALPFMDNTKVVGITSVTPLSVFSYAITSNTNAGAVSATVSGDNIILTPVASGTATIGVRATNLDGYSLNQLFTVTTKSNVATLSNLVPGAGALSPVFSSAKTSYTAIVPNTTESFTLIPTLTHAQAAAQVNGVPVASGITSGAIPLQPGGNLITVLVTAEDGVTTKSYVVNVTRTPLAPVATTLAASGTGATQATLNGTVNAKGASTAASFDYGKTTGYGSSIAATPSPFAGGSATAVSAVLAGLTPGTIYHYRVKGSNAAGAAPGAHMTFTTKSTVATLSKLVLSAGTLTPVFSSAASAYAATVPSATASLTVTPTATQSQATVQVNGVVAPSGTASGAIALAPGANAISILVTAQDGQTTKNHTLTVTRAPAPVAITQAATSITAASAIFNGTINAGGASTAASFDYGLTTAYGSTATAAPSPVSGSTNTAVSATMAGLQPSKTYHYRVRGVSAGGTSLGVDATFTTTSNVATLSGLVLSTGALTPAFAGATTSYTRTEPAATASLTVTPTASNANATVTVNGETVASGGASPVIALSPGLNTITVQVSAQDGVTTKTYTVNVTRLAAPAVATFGATNVTAVGAKLNGTINAHNTSTAASFEYGTTVAYGKSAAATPSTVTGSSVTAVSATLSGLMPGTEYHYRVKGTSAIDTIRGDDATFTTPNNVAVLSGLVLSSGSLSPAFASATTSYAQTVPNSTGSLTVTPVSGSADATVTVNGIVVASGSASGAINLNVGANTITIVGTAQDGTTKKTYTVTVTRAAALASVTTQPASAVGTTGATLNGTVDTANNTNTTVSFEYGLTTSYGSTVAGVPALVGGTASTGVSAVLGGLMPGKLYHYRIKGVNAAGPKTGADATFTTTSNVATLSGLALSTGALTPAFAAATTTYTQKVSNATISLTVTPTPGNANATVTVNGVTVNSGTASGAISLSPGLNTIVVQVTAQDGVTTKTYTVGVTRTALPVVATLAATNVSATGAKLNGTINALNLSTAASFDYGTTTAYGKSAAATPSPVTGGAVTPVSATLTGLLPGTMYHYCAKGVSSGGASPVADMTFTTPNNVATLSSIGLSNGILSPVFSSAGTAYTVSVNNVTESLTVTPVSTSADATVTVNGAAVVSGNPSAPINLSVGANTVSIVGTAQDGTTKKTYTITVTRSAVKASVTTQAASAVGTTGATLNGTVNTANNASTAVSFDYGLTTSYGSTASGAPASVGGTASTNVSAALGGLMPGKLYHYRIKGVNPAGTALGADATFTTTSNVATLSGLVLSSGALTPAFSSATTTYTQTVPNATSSLTVKPTATSATAALLLNNTTAINSGATSAAISLSAGLNTITVKVTAQDGVTTKTYTVNVTRLEAPAVLTLEATNVTATGAKLNGAMNALNSSTVVSFEYGTTTAYGKTAAATPSPVTGMAATAVSATLAGLAPGTTYHYRIKAVSAGGTTRGEDDVTFATPSNVATLAGLGLSSGAPSPAFAGATTAYTVTVSNSTASITVTPVVANANATVTVNDVTVISGSASAAIPLSSGLNLIMVRVTAEDGVATKSYALNVTRTAPPEVATLGATNVTAVGAKLNGTINALNTATAASFEYGTTTAYGSSAAATPSTVTGNAATTVSATLAGLVPKETYHYRVKGTRGAETIRGDDATFTTPGNVATLSGLVLSPGTLSPVFAGATTLYTATVGNATDSLTVTPAMSDGGATVKVNGLLVTPGTASAPIGLNVGANTISVVGTAEDGVTAKAYTITVTRTALAPAMTTLAAAGVNGTSATVNGTANANNASTVVSFDYGLTTAYGKSATAAPSPLTGGTTTPVSAVLNGLQPGATYHYRVKGVNVAGATPGTDLTFTTPSNVATLSGLVLSTGAPSPVFSTATTNYSQTVPGATSSITVTPTVSNANATVTVNGVTVPSGSASPAIVLSPGLNTIAVLVTAQDGVTTVAYTLNVTRTTPAPTVVTMLADSVTATGATVHGTVDAQGTSTSVSFDYGLTTAYGSSAVAAESPANGAAATPMSAMLTGLLPGATYHYRASALNAGGLSSGLDATFYTPSNVTTLSGLVLNTGALSPAFSSTTTSYTQTVPTATASLTVKPTATHPAATLLLDGAAIASGSTSGPIPLVRGPNAITVQVTAEDGVAMETYTINVTRTTPPPTLVTLQADNLTKTDATLHGTVNAEETLTAVSFEYGLTTAYGSSATAAPANVTGASVTPVTAALTGLLPGRTYHYRVSAQNVGGASKGLDATFTTIHDDVLADLTPASTSSAATAPVVLHATALVPGESIIIERFADADADGIVDDGEFLAERFAITDGQVTSIGGVRNTNMPGDEDGAADGQVSIHLRPAIGPELGRLAGAQIIRVSSPGAAFLPVTSPLAITHPAQAQSIAGLVTDGTNPVPYASVVLLDASNHGGFALGVVANAAGQFTIDAPAGSYEIFAVKGGYVGGLDPVTLGSGNALMQNIQLAAAPTFISGAVADAGTSAGLGGVQLFAESLTGLVALTSSNADGTFVLPVSAGQWELSASEISLGHIGYLGLDDQNGGIMADTNAAAVTGANINVPKVTALIHGTVADSGANPLAGIRLGAGDTGHLYNSDAITDAAGHYVLGVIAGSWDAHISTDSPGLAGYLIPNGQPVTIAAAQAVQTDFTMIAVAGQITGSVKDAQNNPIPNVRVFGSATVAGTGYSTSAVTDAGGSYSLPVFAGDWNVDVSRDDLETQGYLTPSSQSGVVGMGPVILNFIAPQATTTITGSVKDSQNNPLGGVRVSGSAALGGVDYSTSTITDANGNYSLDVFSGTWNVGVSGVNLQAQGFLAPSDQDVVVGIGPATLDFVAPLATTTIVGSVKDTQNNPISGVRVLGSATVGGSGYTTSGITDAAGNYSLPVFAGAWSVDVSDSDLHAQGYLAPAGQDGVVTIGMVTLNFVAPQATTTIAGFVKDAQDNPIAGVQVFGSATLGGVSYSTSAVTNAGGNYSLPVFSGSWNVIVSSASLQSQGYLTPPDQSADVGAGTAALNFIAPHSTSTIHGTVRTPSDIPLPFVGVTAHQIGGSGLQASGMTDANGHYTLGVIIGSWDVGAIDTAGYVPERQNVIVTANGSSVQQDLVVHPITAHLRGQVLDDSNNPVPNLKIIARDSNVISTSAIATTDAGGNFDLAVYGGEAAGVAKQWALQVLLDDNPVTHISSGASFAVLDGEDINGITYQVHLVTAHLRGQVLDESNAAVGNITITAGSQDFAASTGSDVTAGGLFDIPIFAGNWKLGLGNIQGLGLIPQNYPIYVTENVDQNDLVFRAHHTTTTIDGVLKDAQDNPIGGVRISGSALADGIQYLTSATTNAAGNYSLPVFSGTWDVAPSSDDLQARGYQSVPLQNAVVGSGAATLNFGAGLSSNARLASLTLSAGTLSPVFSGTTTNYTVTVGNTVGSITVTPTMSNAAATVTVNGVSVASGSASGAIDLDFGANTITIVGVAQNGAATQTYTVIVGRAAAFAMAPLAGASTPAGEAVAAAKARLTAPAAGSTLTSGSATFQWDAGSGVSEYRLSVGSSAGAGDIYSASQGTVLARTLGNLPTDGREFYVTLGSKIDGEWQSNTYAFVAWTQPAPLKARLTGPTANGGRLPGASVPFTWDPGQGVSEYWLSIGATVGGTDFYDASEGMAQARTVSLPTDGGDLYVTLKSRINGVWLANNYVFAAADTSIKAVLSEPADQTRLSSPDTAFIWNEIDGASEYWLSIGTTEGGTDIYDASQGTAASNTLSLPTDGRELFVALKTRINGAWVSSGSTLFASGSGAPAAAQITSPANHTALNGASVTFTWDAGSGVTEYWLTVGTSVTARDVFDASQGANQAATVAVPTDGSPLYITLFSLIDGKWLPNQYLYDAAVTK